MHNRAETLDMAVLLASGVHNLKNSIAAFVGSVEGAAIRIEDAAEAQHFRQSLGYLRKSHDDLVLLLNLYKLGQSLYPLDISDYPVSEIICEALVHFSPGASSGRNITVDCPAALTWYLDRDLVMTSLCNAIENALRHARREIRLQAHAGNGWLEIQVADDGPGYPVHHLEQAPAGSPRPAPGDHGTGLGLVFAAAIAQVHKNNGRTGQLRLDNNGPNGGARFALRLP